MMDGFARIEVDVKVSSKYDYSMKGNAKLDMTIPVDVIDMFTPNVDVQTLIKIAIEDYKKALAEKEQQEKEDEE